MNKKSLGYVILKIIGKIAFFLMLVYIAGLVIDHIFHRLYCQCISYIMN